ncbi:hypothetical protein [Labrys sp. ZIDIC5]|uniref:hypothetical protein n=1 Tax=Labrys sedimenti TaxID=3106036 RepID=UPI002ACAA1EF|nr:hypothetical protein [Labrys sp. ZIDIC5]MDZ5450817.1 hypothetical protein [Labrys sp. ZIDIC5]
MPRLRLMISGITSREQAGAAVEAGADAIGLDPAAFPQAGPEGSAILAAIALALPPAVTPILITPALTAGTVAQQVDASATLAVRLARPIAASEYPGLKRIIRGRKIIQSIDPARNDAGALVEACASLADALHFHVGTADDLSACRCLIELTGLPCFLGLTDPALLPAAAALRPHAVDLLLAGEDGFDASASNRLAAALAAI